MILLFTAARPTRVCPQFTTVSAMCFSYRTVKMWTWKHFGDARKQKSRNASKCWVRPKHLLHLLRNLSQISERHMTPKNGRVHSIQIDLSTSSHHYRLFWLPPILFSNHKCLISPAYCRAWHRIPPIRWGHRCFKVRVRRLIKFNMTTKSCNLYQCCSKILYFKSVICRFRHHHIYLQSRHSAYHKFIQTFKIASPTSRHEWSWPWKRFSVTVENMPSR